MRLIKDYMYDDCLRHELNELAKQTFWIEFERWVTEGYYDGEYIPYSYEENGQIISNVSVNRMHFLQNGEEKHYIQIGTVMTRPEFRKKGYAAALVREVLKDYAGKCDGIYLFANMNALGFYDKLGFQQGLQYRYILKKEALADILQKKKDIPASEQFHTIEMTGEPFQKYFEAVKSCTVNSSFEQINQYGRHMFHTFHEDAIWYCEELGCYAIVRIAEASAEHAAGCAPTNVETAEGGTSLSVESVPVEKAAAPTRTLYLRNIVAGRKVDLAEVIARLPLEFDRVIAEFVPCLPDRELFDAVAYDGADDYRFYFMGGQLEKIEADKLCFPAFSHA